MIQYWKMNRTTFGVNSRAILLYEPLIASILTNFYKAKAWGRKVTCWTAFLGDCFGPLGKKRQDNKQPPFLSLN